MRLVVPLQGIVQGRGGLILGSVIPCAMFYFLRFYVKRRRSNPPQDPGSNSNPSSPVMSSASRSNLLSRASIGRPHVSNRVYSIAKANDSPDIIGMDKVAADPYDRVGNPNGVVQLGAAQSLLTLDLIENWITENLNESILGGGDNRGGLSLSDIITYQPLDGMTELKVAMAGFMSQVGGGTVTFNPSQIVLTSGATPAIEILCFALADHGDAFLVPAPYYPGFLSTMLKFSPIVMLSLEFYSSKDG